MGTGAFSVVGPNCGMTLQFQQGSHQNNVFKFVDYI